MSSTAGISKPASSWHLNVNDWAGAQHQTAPPGSDYFGCSLFACPLSPLATETLGYVVPKQPEPKQLHPG